MSSVAKSVPGDLQLSDLTMKKTTTAKLLLIYFIRIHILTLDYKIKSLTLLKQINFTKQTRIKLTGNAHSWLLCIAYRNIGIVSRGLLLAVSG